MLWNTLIATAVEKKAGQAPVNSPEEVLDYMEKGDGALFDPIITQIKEIGSSAFNLGTTAGVVIFVISIMLCGFCFMVWSRSSSKKDENKSAIGNIALGATFIFAAVPIASIVLSIFRGN